MMAASKEDEAAMPRLAPLAQEQRLRHLVEPFLLAISMSVYGRKQPFGQAPWSLPDGAL
jgi:hypothetical protein